jgi:hypothetical protein
VSSELTPYEKNILQRVIDRRNAVPEESEPSEPQRDSETEPTSIVTEASDFNLDHVMNNYQTFEDEKLHVALKKALDHAGSDGRVLTMPELIRLKNHVGDDHYFWENYADVHTEENMGTDTDGLYVPRGKGVVLVVHGGGLLTPDRIKEAINDGLVDGSGKYEPSEFSELLKGNLPSGEKIPIYRLDDVKKETPKERRFGVALPFDEAAGTSSGQHSKNDFVNNPLVVARNGGKEGLEEYFDKADRQSGVGNYHVLTDRNIAVPQGRVLFLYDNISGLNGYNDLYDYGRFVGVRKNA